MNYNKEFIDLLSDLSNIQSQLIFNDTGDNNFEIHANDKDVTVCFMLSSPKSYFDFPGETIAFYDFSKFKTYFNIFNKPTKDPLTSNTPKLEIETNAEGEGYMLKVMSSIDARCFNNKLGDPAVVAQPQFNKVVLPSVDAELSWSAADVNDLLSMIKTVNADTIEFHCEGSICSATLRNSFSGDTYAVEYNLVSAIETPFDITIPKTGISLVPTDAYQVKFCARGLIEMTQLRDDETKLSLYLTRKK